MKKFYKVLGGLFSLVFLFDFIVVYGVPVEEASWNASTFVSKDIINHTLSDDICKREERIIKEINFSGGLSKCNYKYIKVLKNISYLESDTKKPVAIVYIDTNFRYNPFTRESECISSSESTVIYNNDYILNASARSLNKNIELGSSITSIHLKYLNETINEEISEIDCSHCGEVNFNDL